MMVFAMLRERWSSLLGAFISLALGVLLLTMTGLTFASAVPVPPARLSAASVLVQSPAPDEPADTFHEHRPWSPEQVASLVTVLRGLDGVTEVVADRSLYAQPIVAGIPYQGSVSAHPWSTTRLGPNPRLTGAPALTADQVALGRELSRELSVATGDQLTLLTADGPARFTVSGTVDGAGVYLADGRAEELSDGVRIIGVITSPHADPATVAWAAAGVVGADGRVLVGAARSAAEPRSDARIRWIGMQVLVAMGAIALFVAVFVVASTFSFGVLQRRRELAVLRIAGATPAQVRRLLLGEALVVGALAGACGVLGGVLVAPLLGALLVRAGFEPSTFEVRLSPLPMLAAYAAGLLVALAGVLAAARSAAGIRPLEALRAAEVERRPMTRWRWLLGSATGLLGLLLSVAAATSTGADLANFALLGAMTLIVGLSLLAPAVLPPLIRLLMAPLASRSGALAMLVRANSITGVRRTAATATPVLLTVAFAVLVTGMVQTTAGAFAARRAERAPATMVLAPAGAPGLSEAAVAARPGLSLLPTTVYLDDVPLSAVGVSPGRLPLTALSGSLSALEQPDLSPADPARTPAAASGTAMPGAEPARTTVAASGTVQPATDLTLTPVAASEAVMTAHGWAVGADIELTVETGRRLSGRLVAMLPDGGAPAELLLRRSVVRQADPSALTDVVYLTGANQPGELPGDLAARVTDSVGHAAAADAAEDRLVWLFTLILVLMAVGFTVLAVANTQAMASIGRRTDFAVLRSSGATPRQVLGMVALETLLVVTLGVILGTLVAAPALLGVRAGLQDQVGVPVPLAVDWPALGVVLACCLLLGMVSSVLPARSTLRRAGQAARPATP